GKEVDIGLDGGRDKQLRPADMLLYSWDDGLDVCVDLTGSSPLTQTGMVDFVPGRAVFDAAQRKRDKYMAKCAAIGYGFLLFSFSSLGELEADAVTLLKRIRKFSMAQDIRARVAVHIFNRISFAIAKGVETQIVSRLPSNLFMKRNEWQSVPRVGYHIWCLLGDDVSFGGPSFDLVPQPEYTDKYEAIDLRILDGCLCVVGWLLEALCQTLLSLP
ncbi:hypothetical protein Tco_0780553, partial [Tanacetum coccineum]